MSTEQNMSMRFKGIMNDEKFISAMQGLQSFVIETGADIDMAYDWVADQSEPFVADLLAWDFFYDVYAEAIN